MLFKTTEQHEALRAKVRALAETEVKPQAFLMARKISSPMRPFGNWLSWV